MGRKSTISYKTKVSAIESYENNVGSISMIAKMFNVKETSLKRWIANYQSQGIEGLITKHKHTQRTKEFKTLAVEEYLSGNFSLKDICIKYKISSDSILRRWIKVYNDGHKELKSTGSGGRKPMTKARKTTFEERIEIVQFCIANGKDYGLTIDKFNISYQQIYLWVRKYEEKGVDGLVDRRGKSKPENELTELDRLKAENKMLAAKNQELQMEIDVIKKLKEVERRYR
jgi:transposase-like protein